VFLLFSARALGSYYRTLGVRRDALRH